MRLQDGVCLLFLLWDGIDDPAEVAIGNPDDICCGSHRKGRNNSRTLGIESMRGVKNDT